jgi:nucleoside-diphosphate-sugar epimerase
LAFVDGLGAEKVFGDLNDEKALADAVKGVKTVYHSAAKVGDWGPWDEFQKVTIDGTKNLLKASANAGVSRFLHISSISVYGYVDGEGKVLDETAPLGVDLYRWSYYSKAKVIAENTVWDWHKQKKINATVVRPSWLYGQRDRASIGRMINAIRTRKAKLIGGGDNKLTLSYAGNVAEGAILAASKPEAIGQAYNCCSDGVITLAEYFNGVAKVLGCPPVTRKVPYRVAKTAGLILEAYGRLLRKKEPPLVSRYAAWLMGRRILFSNEKIRALGWKPTITYDVGIPMTVKWYLDTFKK